MKVRSFGNTGIESAFHNLVISLLSIRVYKSIVNDMIEISTHKEYKWLGQFWNEQNPEIKFAGEVTYSLTEGIKATFFVDEEKKSYINKPSHLLPFEVIVGSIDIGFIKLFSHYSISASSHAQFQHQKYIIKASYQYCLLTPVKECLKENSKTPLLRNSCSKRFF